MTDDNDSPSRWHADDRPPEKLSAGSITLLRYRGGEVEDLRLAVNDSLAHLRPWMPWAAEPHTEEDQAEFVRRVTEQWDNGESFSYWIREEESGQLVGSVGLHPRIGPGALEIGYWVHVSRIGRGYATAAAEALTTAAFAMSGVQRVEIHCDEANVASAAIPRRLGYRLDRVLDDEIQAPSETGRSMVWVTDAENWRQRHPAIGAQ